MTVSLKTHAIATESIPIIDTQGIRQRNQTRKQLKRCLPEGQWVVKEKHYRGSGAKYVVIHQTAVGHNNGQIEDHVIVPEGFQRDEKAFIAFTRNDEPEKDIDQLLMVVDQLAHFEAVRQEMAQHILKLKLENQQLQHQLEQTTLHLQRTQDSFEQYHHKTQHLHADAAILREALRFYANPAHWEWQLVSHPIIKDNGQIAEMALSQSTAGLDPNTAM